jgi:hypothetical protein
MLLSLSRYRNHSKEDNFIEYLGLFFNGEKWYDMLLDFSMKKDYMSWNDVTSLHVERIKINNL